MYVFRYSLLLLCGVIIFPHKLKHTISIKYLRKIENEKPHTHTHPGTQRIFKKIVSSWNENAIVHIYF